MRTSKHHPGRLSLLLAPTLLSLIGCPGLTMSPQPVQTSRGEMQALLGESDSFPRFSVGDGSIAMSDAALDPDDDLIVARRGDDARAFLVDQLAFHHVAQGTLGDAPYALVYCVVCDVGIGLTPVLDGTLLHLSAGGLSNGVVLARDDETGSYWDMTGEAIAGPLRGRRLEAWPIERTNVATALAAEPGLRIARNEQISAYGTWWSRCVTLLTRDAEGYMPPYFRKTLGQADGRREELELGLGVVIGDRARFYPARELATLAEGTIVDALGTGDALVSGIVELAPTGDGVTWNARLADGSRPFQVWGRWYGFSMTYPGCDVFAADSAAVLADAPIVADKD